MLLLVGVRGKSGQTISDTSHPPLSEPERSFIDQKNLREIKRVIKMKPVVIVL